MAFANPAARRHRRRARHSPLAAPLALFLIAGVAAVSYVGYVLWPRWPDAPVAIGAPALPIVVAGAAFNIEPAAIRMPVQRHPGTQDRVDLAYVWPTLVPPDPAEKTAAPGAPIEPIERLFVTIEGTDGTMPPIERVETIYPRYLVAEPVAGPAGLTLRGFRKDTPYADEELAFESNANMSSRRRMRWCSSGLSKGFWTVCGSIIPMVSAIRCNTSKGCARRPEMRGLLARRYWSPENGCEQSGPSPAQPATTS